MEAAGFLYDIGESHDSDDETEISIQSNRTCKYMTPAEFSIYGELIFSSKY